MDFSPRLKKCAQLWTAHAPDQVLRRACGTSRKGARPVGRAPFCFAFGEDIFDKMKDLRGGFAERLIQIRNNVVRVFNANRQAYDIVSSTSCLALFICQLSVCG